MKRTKVESTRGILNPAAAKDTFRLSRHHASEDLKAFVQRYWIIDWDLSDRTPHAQETLPYPCVNLVFERHNTRVYGVARGRFSRVLEGKGRVVGVKFRPASFYPFLKSSVHTLTGTSIAFREVFDADPGALEEAVLSPDDQTEMIVQVEDFLTARLPGSDATAARINLIVDDIMNEPGITRVDDLVCRTGMSKRTLQRLFRQYVGVSPKWVIKRNRLQEAAEQLAAGKRMDLANLALELGYFDQAHFNKDFKALVGTSPAEYASGLASAVTGPS